MTERRRRRLVVDLVLARDDPGRAVLGTRLTGRHSHPVEDVATVAGAVTAALLEHPGARVLGTREP